MKKLLLLLVLLNLFQYLSFAQKDKVNTLFDLLSKNNADTTTINYLLDLSLEYKNIGEFDSALYYGNKALHLFDSLNFKGVEQWKVLKLKSKTYSHIGNAYLRQGNYPRALECYFSSMKINETVLDLNKVEAKYGLASNLGNIGIVYYVQNDFTKALEYHSGALKINLEIENKSGIAKNYGSLGTVYSSLGKDSLALEYHKKALEIDEELGVKSGIARHLTNIGATYARLGNYFKATDYFFKALELNEKLGNKSGIAINLGHIGTIYTDQKKYNDAERYLLKALSIAAEIGSLRETEGAHKLLSELYFSKGEYKKAFIHYEQHSITKDSIFNIEKEQDITRKEMTYEFEKKEQAAQLEQEKKAALHKAEVQQQKTQRNGFIGGFALMLGLAAVSYRNYRNKRKAHAVIAAQKKEVEHQKALVEEKNRDITDSINYAKRLQQAILPSGKAIKENLKDSFILYKPKDIVAGDFYWMERKGDFIFIAAADCTGHGVPGAMISVVCSNALNSTVKEFGLTEPGKILDKVRELVIETFEKSESEVRDGMDISLCAINKKTNEVGWAGANNPLWILRNSEIIEYKPDKQPVGKYMENKPFTTHDIELQKGDTLYLFTDGYADQFGGEKGKKFKYSKLKELLLTISEKPMSEQRQILNETFETWRGNLEQVDDVCIIGVKV